ncbi:MAG TPA: Rrf2 family transcriptional regulator [Aminobacterium sp.]|nr:Rrf2 family transcriptional regulator [Aminobacterium sp.]
MNTIIAISEAASLAFHGMGLLAISGERMSAREIAERIGVSETHLAKVFQRLVRAGLVVSSRGPGGGFQLARSADSISLFQIYVEIEGEPSGEYCLLKAEECPFASCLFGGELQKMTRAFIEYLKEKNLADFMRSGRRVERGYETENYQN